MTKAKQEQLFNCCQCMNGPMIVAINLYCHECSHTRCINCSHEWVHASSAWGEPYSLGILAQQDKSAASTNLKKLDTFTWPESLEKYTNTQKERYLEDHTSGFTPSILENPTVYIKSPTLSSEKDQAMVPMRKGSSSLWLRFPFGKSDHEARQTHEKHEDRAYSLGKPLERRPVQEKHGGGTSWRHNDSAESMPHGARIEDLNNSPTIKTESEDDSELGPMDTPARSDSDSGNSEETLCDSEQEFSEDDSSIRSKINRKHHLLDDFIRRFSWCVNDYLRRQSSVRQFANDQSTNTSSLTQHGHAEASESGSLKRKQDRNRRSSREGSADDGDRSPEKKRPKGNDTNPSEGSERQRFACPFYKRKPSKYRTWRSCVGPGWETVHRVKAHLYGKHKRPIRCPRCVMIFTTEMLRDEHIRSGEPCERQERIADEGLSVEQEKELKKRKQIRPKPSEHELWNRMYKILFPLDDPSIMPSPYYDMTTNDVHEGSSSNGAFREYLQYDFLPEVRQDLVTAIARELLPTEREVLDLGFNIARQHIQHRYNQIHRNQQNSQLSQAQTTPKFPRSTHHEQALEPWPTPGPKTEDSEKPHDDPDLTPMITGSMPSTVTEIDNDDRNPIPGRTNEMALAAQSSETQFRDVMGALDTFIASEAWFGNSSLHLDMPLEVQFQNSSAVGSQPDPPNFLQSPIISGLGTNTGGLGDIGLGDWQIDGSDAQFTMAQGWSESLTFDNINIDVTDSVPTVGSSTIPHRELPDVDSSIAEQSLDDPSHTTEVEGA